jgi:hypothetical protein
VNVIQVVVQISRKERDKNIIDQIISKYKGVKSPAIFLRDCRAKWDNYNEKLNALYDSELLIAHGNIMDIDYFLFEKNAISQEKISLNIIIVAHIDKIDLAVKTVVKEIKKILQHLKVKVLRDSDVILFPYNEYQKDIYDPSSYVIKAGFAERKFDVLNKYKYSLIFCISLVFYFLYMINKFDAITNNIFLSLATYGIVTVAIDSILLLISKNYSIIISDLSHFTLPGPMPFVENGAENELENPGLGPYQ